MASLALEFPPTEALRSQQRIVRRQTTGSGGAGTQDGAVIYNGHVMDEDSEIDYMPVNAKNPNTPTLRVGNLGDGNEAPHAACHSGPGYRTDLEALTDSYTDRFGLINSFDRLLKVSQDYTTKIVRVHQKKLQDAYQAYTEVEPSQSISAMDSEYSAATKAIRAQHAKVLEELEAIVTSGKRRAANGVLQAPASDKRTPAAKAHDLKQQVLQLEKLNLKTQAKLATMTSESMEKTSQRFYALLDEPYLASLAKKKQDEEIEKSIIVVNGGI